jgi:hypothetical protein
MRQQQMHTTHVDQHYFATHNALNDAAMLHFEHLFFAERRQILPSPHIEHNQTLAHRCFLQCCCSSLPTMGCTLLCCYYVTGMVAAGVMASESLLFRLVSCSV